LIALRDARDKAIFEAARIAEVIVMTKDVDFVEMVNRLGPPPQVVWLRCGNTSNSALLELLTRELPTALVTLEAGAQWVELGVQESNAI